MFQQLTQKTKNNIKEFFDLSFEKQIEELPSSFLSKFTEYGMTDLPSEIIKQINDIAFSELQDNFTKVEDDHLLLEDYYNENGDIPDYETLRQLSLEFAKTLI